MKLTFTKKDFDRMQRFDAAFKTQLGANAYVQTTYASLAVQFSPKLTAMLRPFPPEEALDFELTQIRCKCGKETDMFFAAPGEEVIWKCAKCPKDKV